ncbi:hypothetical protein H70357_20080 [Paenibacillus sp. FSL H7-0357]|uniref:hypothetical protein n=1 Tax=Paenibacillus sp. FSL H7-0357 TaxID=1536774 RepID=UPI0004F856AA|nr:hypothetical protein [Paenibacillus sp. FSL H7-0357]AIQ18740.1 hypothetical protein H70357_20080 [Paenibacillus sp. FSL H7-0357]
MKKSPATITADRAFTGAFGLHASALPIYVAVFFSQITHGLLSEEEVHSFTCVMAVSHLPKPPEWLIRITSSGPYLAATSTATIPDVSPPL